MLLSDKQELPKTSPSISYSMTNHFQTLPLIPLPESCLELLPFPLLIRVIWLLLFGIPFIVSVPECSFQCQPDPSLCKWKSPRGQDYSGLGLRLQADTKFWALTSFPMTSPAFPAHTLWPGHSESGTLSWLCLCTCGPLGLECPLSSPYFYIWLIFMCSSSVTFGKIPQLPLHTPWCSSPPSKSGDSRQPFCWFVCATRL